MGSGGYAARPPPAAAAAERLAQRRAVEKAAFTPDYGFDPATLQDLQLPTIDEAGVNCATMYAGAFDDVALDASLWDAPACEVPPFGTLAVDALFTMPGSLPGSLPGSPTKGCRASPFSSPLRAPGSPAPTTPALAEAAAAAADTPSPALEAAASVPHITSIPAEVTIQTAHAASVDPEVVLVAAPRQPKRPAEDDAEYGGRPARRQRTDGDESDDSDASALSLERDDIMPPLVATPLGTQVEVEAALPNLPTSQQTSCGEVVTLSPTLWRDARMDAHPPFRIHVNAGLHSMRAPGVEAPVTLFGAIHPRIVTTGQPHRRLGKSRLGRAAEAAPPPVTRQTRGHPDRAVSGELRREKSTDHSACALEEVWLLQRRLGRGQAPQPVLAAHQCTDFDGTTLGDTPAWGGAFAVDVVARVAEPSGGGSFWLKAVNRSVQDLST